MKKPEPTKKAGSDEGQRIAKVMARAGVCSRRDAERMINEGRVSVDGSVLKSPAFNVSKGQKITVDGKPLSTAEATRLWRYHKPAGLITTARDPQGRGTVFDHLPPFMPRVISVGRLDLNSEGLLLLTNDGALARLLELPSTAWKRCYRARIHVGRVGVDEKKLEKLKNGITVEGVRYGPIEAGVEHVKGSNAWLTLTLTEGKNREIRKVMGHLGYDVNRLIRVSFGPFELGKLAEGDVEEIPFRVIKTHMGALLEKKA